MPAIFRRGWAADARASAVTFGESYRVAGYKFRFRASGQQSPEGDDAPLAHPDIYKRRERIRFARP
jgi:hypothetical protein